MADQKITELDAKATPADTDLIPIVDIVADPDQTKKVTWANVKATLKTYFDTLYALLAHKDSHDPEDGGDPLDCAAASEIAGVQAAAEGSAHSYARSDHAHQIQHGIADNHLLTVDGTINNGEYLKATANGAEGKTFAEVITDLQNNINKIVDPTDQDTLVEAEEDQVTMDVAGTEAFNLDSVGILTLVKNSGCHFYSNTDQHIPDATQVRVLLDTEVFDIQSEFNSTVKTGAADATEANKLHDADGGFSEDDVGAWIWNTTDDTYTTVTAFVDSGELTLTNDIMADGEGYKLYHSKFTCTKAGKYLCVGKVQYEGLSDQTAMSVYIYKNGAAILDNPAWAGKAAALSSTVIGVANCSASDYLEFRTKHWEGNTENIIEGQPNQTFFQIVKIS